MMQSSAKYLLRFDDACPTANWAIWDRLEEILDAYNIRPIVAVIPDNRDRSLIFNPSISDFWGRVRGWSRKGWTIGLHGYTHQFWTTSAGVVGLNHYSEFSGLSFEEQAQKIASGFNIMASEGVTPSAWVAPAHSFDHNTVRVLADVLDRRLFISDGLFPLPGVDRDGLLWIPQQLWRFRTMPSGVWTVCAHPSSWRLQDLDALASALDRYAPSIVSTDYVSAKYKHRRLTACDRVFETAWRRAVLWKTDCHKRTAPPFHHPVSSEEMSRVR